VFKYAFVPWFAQALQVLALSGVHGVAVDVWVSSCAEVEGRCHSTASGEDSKGCSSDGERSHMRTRPTVQEALGSSRGSCSQVHRTHEHAQALVSAGPTAAGAVILGLLGRRCMRRLKQRRVHSSSNELWP
jgi:hypothetical protein